MNAVRLAARKRLAAARRIVVKAGTNVVMREEGGVALGRLFGLIESVAALRKQGRDVLIVSSGAIGLGVQRLRLKSRPADLSLKQACAAVGQCRLMAVYEEGFGALDVPTAQVLLTEDDFADPERFRNLSATLGRLFALGVVPILNENDVVSTAELETPGAARRQDLRRQRPALRPRHGARRRPTRSSSSPTWTASSPLLRRTTGGPG